MDHSDGAHTHEWKHTVMSDGCQMIECECGAYVSVFDNEVHVVDSEGRSRTLTMVKMPAKG